MVWKAKPLLWLVLVMFISTAASAAETAPTAYSVVDSATTRVMAVVNDASAYIDQDPARYYRELQAILDEVVDFSGFARGVMGPYASKSYYQSLSPDGKQQLRKQVERFTVEMRLGLVRIYGKGLLVFSGSRVEVQRPEETGDSNKGSIVQLIYSENTEPYVIHYVMRRSRSGEWRLRNLIVESINLGQVYRNQFQAAVRDHDGDLDAVIDNWSTVEIDG